MIDTYMRGSLAQMIERARQLTAMIPRNLPRAYDGLSHRCRAELTSILAQLRYIAEDVEINKPPNRSLRVRAFKRAVADLDFIETTGIAALNRCHSDDHQLNAIVGMIADEIQYPLPIPCCSSLSRDYYYINTHLSLLFVPLAESKFSLHLSDLYHELAHPLLSTEDDPIIEPFQQKFNEALAMCLSDTNQELSRLERGRHPERLKLAVKAWERSWARGWLAEFFCDVFAVATAGPAFCWSHLHLSLKRGMDPFSIPRFQASTHPADAARMSVALHALEQVGCTQESRRIAEHWSTSIDSLGYSPEPEYRICYRDEILRQIASFAFEGTKAIGVTTYNPAHASGVARMLNTAWQAFWSDTDRFTQIEKALLRELFGSTSR